jgi:hypothetical protein
VNSEISTTGMGPEQKSKFNTRQRRANGSHGDEKKLKTDNLAISNYMLRSSKRDWREGADVRVMTDKGQGTTAQ